LKSQIELVDPMAANLRQRAATRFFQAGFLLLLEFIVWILLVACFAFVVFMNKLYPFYLLDQIAHDNTVLQQYLFHDLQVLNWSIRGIVIFTGLLLFWIGRMLAKIRIKNSLINLAGKNMKTLIEQFFQRRSEIEALENKFPVQLPADSDTVIPPPADNHNDTLL